MADRADVLRDAFRVDVHAQIHRGLGRTAVAEGDHLAEFPACVHVQQRDRRWRRGKGLEQQVQQHRAVLADRIQHHRRTELGGDLAQDVDALGLETVEMGKGWQGWQGWQGHQRVVGIGGETSRWKGKAAQCVAGPCRAEISTRHNAITADPFWRSERFPNIVRPFPSLEPNDRRQPRRAAQPLARRAQGAAGASGRRSGRSVPVVAVRVYRRLGAGSPAALAGGTAGWPGVCGGAREPAPDRAVREPDRQCPAAGRAAGRRGRGRRRERAPAACRRLPHPRAGQRTPVVRGDQHPGRRRSAG